MAARHSRSRGIAARHFRAAPARHSREISARHSREGGNPVTSAIRRTTRQPSNWIPAFAGMTSNNTRPARKSRRERPPQHLLHAAVAGGAATRRRLYQRAPAHDRALAQAHALPGNGGTEPAERRTGTPYRAPT